MSLDSETLERLVIDRELGELSGDAAALLESYLAQRPVQGAGLRSIEETVRVARELLLPVGNAETEALPKPRFMRATPARLRFGDALRGGIVGFAAAAAIALAVWMGFAPTRISLPQQVSQQMIVSNVHHETAQESGGFWNVNDLRRGLASRPSGDTNKIEWTGPITRPKIGA
jgi:hypothetical protein